MIINYITYDSWWDTDITIIPMLQRIAKVKVYVLDPSTQCKYPKKEVPQGVEFVVKRQTCRDRNPKSLLVAVSFLYKIIRHSRNNDLFFFIPGKNIFLLYLALKLFPKSRTIISTHNYISHGDTKAIGTSFMDKITRSFFDNFSYFHFFSKLQNDYFRKDYANKKSFYTEMPLKDFGCCKEIKSDKNIKLLFFGLIREYKRLDLLINAINELNATNIKVVIAGNINENDKAKYLTMIKDKSKYDLHFGFVDNEDIPQYFSSSDFLVLPYRSATQSGPSLIAINYGLPIIASDIPTFRNLVKDGKNGFLFENGNIDNLKEVLEKVVQMSKEDIADMKQKQLIFKEEYNNKYDITSCFDKFITDNRLRSEKS